MKKIIGYALMGATVLSITSIPALLGVPYGWLIGLGALVASAAITIGIATIVA